MTADAIAIVMQLFEAFGSGNLGRITDLVAEDVQLFSGGDVDVPFCGRFTGVDDVVAGYLHGLGAVEVRAFEPRTFSASAGRVTVDGSTDAVVRQTGQAYQIDWVMLVELVDDRVVRLSHFYDTHAVWKAFNP